MMKYRILLFLILLTSPFINFSLIPDSHLPLTPLVVLAALPIVFLDRISLNVFGTEDIFFLFFWYSSLISSLMNSVAMFSIDGITQLVNILLTYLIYKVSLFLFFKVRPDADKFLRMIFTYYTWVQVPALIVFVIGLYHPDINERIIYFFNNAGNFSVGAIASTLPGARITGFSPEPSFWSFFVAVNIAIALCLRNPSKFLLSINFLTLILTFGRTGYLIIVCVLVLKIVRGSLWRQSIVALAAISLLFVIRDHLSVANLMSVDDSFRQRIGSVITAINITHQNPFFGIGLGNFDRYAAAQDLDYLNIFNWYLSTLALSGILSFLFLVVMFFALIRRIHFAYQLPFLGTLIGWLTVSAYNLPFVWFTFAALVYASAARQNDFTSVQDEGKAE